MYLAVNSQFANESNFVIKMTNKRKSSITAESEAKAVSENKDKRARTRRSAIKGIGITGLASLLGVNTVGGASGNFTYEYDKGDSSDPSFSESQHTFDEHYSTSGGDYEGSLETSIMTKAANDAFGYWSIPMRISSNQTTWINPPSGDSYLIDHIDHVDTDINWDNSQSSYSDAAIFAENDKEWIGSYETSQTGNEEYTMFDAMLEWGWEMFYDTVSSYVDSATLTLYDKSKITAEMINKYQDHNETNSDITRDWSYGWTEQCTSFANYYVRLYEDEQIDINIGNYVSTQVDSLYNGMTLTVYAPTTSPSSSSMTTNSPDSSPEIESVDSRKISTNPHKYGFTSDQAERLDSGQSINFAPVRVDISDVTHTAPDKYTA